MRDSQGERARDTLALARESGYAVWEEAVQYLLALPGLKLSVHVKGSVAKASADSSGQSPAP